MANAERREHLKQYILACVHDSAFSWNDLANLEFKFVRVLSRDMKIVLKEMGKDGGVNLLRAGAMLLAGFAENVVAGRRR